jgi:hypothetical protein
MRSAIAILLAACGAPTPQTEVPDVSPLPNPIDGAFLVTELEERLERASAVAIDLDVMMAGESEVRMRVALELEQNAVRYRWETFEGDATSVMLMESDFATMRYTAETEVEAGTRDAPEYLRELFVLGIARLGASAALVASLTPELQFMNDSGTECCWAEIDGLEAAAERYEGAEVIAVRGFAGAWGERRARNVTYFDPERRVPIRRENTPINGQAQGTIEIYRRFEITDP